MQKITTFLWYDNNAEEAMNLYTSVFKNSKILHAGRMPDGKVMVGSFELEGQEYMCMNAGPQFKFNEAISLMVKCDTQEEVDHYWNSLTADGGEESMCGWLKDKFGLSWQITPNILLKLMGDKDPVKAKRVMDAMLTMKKIDIKKIEEAYKG